MNGFILLASAVIVVLLSVVIITLYSEDDATKLRIAYFANVGHAIPIVGMEKGFFQDSLGDVTIQGRVFDSGPQAIESLFANSVDLAYVGPGPAINGFLNSENNSVRILAGAASGGASFIIHPDSEISSATDLIGKKIAAPQIGNTQDVSLRYYLSENNLKSADKGGSVIIYNISNPDIYTLFFKGDIDGAWVAEPWASILETELNGKRLFYEEDLWPNQEFASVVLVANTNYAEKNPDIIYDLLDSHSMTAMWINQNPVDTRVVFNNFIESYLGAPFPDDIIDTALSNIVITSDPIPESIYSFAKKADKLGYLGRDGYDLSDIFYYNTTLTIQDDDT